MQKMWRNEASSDRTAGRFATAEQTNKTGWRRPPPPANDGRHNCSSSRILGRHANGAGRPRAHNYRPISCQQLQGKMSRDTNGGKTWPRRRIECVDENEALAAKSSSVMTTSAELTDKQVERLRRVVEEETFEIHGRGNFPTLVVRLCELVGEVRRRMLAAGGGVESVRLNGGAASHVLAEEQEFRFSDVDLIFQCALPDFERAKEAVLDSLLRFLPAGTRCHKLERATLRDVYVRKMVKVDDDNGDRWSLFSLNNRRGRFVELKFVERMRRQFEFSVDSFQICLDNLLPDDNNNDNNIRDEETEQEEKEEEKKKKTKVTAFSVYGDFATALRHLNWKLIDTTRPEQIRGGGLLKYCRLLALGYRPTRSCNRLEPYMCSRFFIDFAQLGQQEQKLSAYLKNHFVGADQHRFLGLLHSVVAQSTVCLMSHERRQTLAMIRDLADSPPPPHHHCPHHHHQHQLFYNPAPQQRGQTLLLYLPKNASYWIPVV